MLPTLYQKTKIMKKNKKEGFEAPFRVNILSYAILFAAMGALFPIVVFFAEFYFGSPSSTSALILLAVIPFGIIGIVIGILYGGLIKLGTKDINDDNNTLWRIFIKTGLVVLFLVITIPVTLTLYQQNLNRPRIILCADSVKAIPKTEIDAEANRLLNAIEMNPDNIEDYEISHNHNVLHVKNFNTGIEKSYDYSKYESIQSIKYSKFSNEKYLAVLMILRATSRKCMFVLFDNSGNCIYQEMITR